MKLQTITTIELSNDCQLRCKYCINRKMESVANRKRQIMSEEVFSATLEVLKELCARGTQAELNMNGNGESFLDPALFSRLRRAKEVIGPSRRLNMSTNGIIMSDDIAKALKASGLDDIQVSIHRPEVARISGQILATNGIRGSFNFGAVSSPHNWAGQIEPEHCVRVLPSIPCHPLMEGRGYVSAEGHLSPCCYDYQLLGVFGDIHSSDLLAREIVPFSLCQTCHQVIPDEIKQAHGVIQPKVIKFSL